MAMAVDSRQQPHFQSMGYDAMRYHNAPQFTNPWVSAPASNQGQMYATSMPQSNDAQRYAPAPTGSAAYAGGQISAPSGMATLDPELFGQAGLQLIQDGMTASRPYNAPYSSATSSAPYAPTSAPQYAAASYGSYASERPAPHPSVTADMIMGLPLDVKPLDPSSLIDMNDRLHHASDAERQSFSDALDASRGMVAMSQSDVTPRNIYGSTSTGRSSNDAYGFPAAHSSRSSISSASTYPTYYNSSVSEASVGDYSSASESADMPTHRTLPRPHGLLGNLPPAPSSMMGQFSSKLSSSSQKKHKCKICDKRFTRPSSLQTHMYSHTGEKPFACDVDGCGRHFSVVSNLRRHRKVHKGEAHDHPSPDDDDC